MSYETIKAALKEKIDSFDAYKKAATKIGGDRYYETNAIWDIQSLGFTPDDTPYGEFNGEYVGEVASRAKEHTFWWFREQARIAVLYPPRTNVMQRLIKQFKLGAYCIHPSTDPAAPEAVTYTPDQAMGIADRQVKLSSLGKLIRKLCPLVSDAHAQKLEAMHRAELDPTFLTATTADEIAYVYQHMDGDSGCMRYDNSRWNLPRGMHPSHVYAADNMGVAYHKVGDAIKSRAVIWTDAAGNKKYVRLYGDAALKRKLESNGYSQGSLAGARIKAIRLAAEYDINERYVVPYIDGQGGAQSDEDGTWGYIPADDTAHIQLVTREVAQRMIRLGYSLTRFKAHSDVRHHISVIDTSAFQFTCPVTGVQVDQLVTTPTYIYINGEVKPAHSSVTEHGYVRSVTAVRDNRHILVYYTEAHQPPMFSNYDNWFDDAATRGYCGQVQLDSRFYPDTPWVERDKTFNLGIDDANYTVLTTDVLRVSDDTGTYTFHHVSEKTQLQYKKEGYVSVPPSGGIKWLVHPSNPYLVPLVSGKWALRNEHNLTKLYDGKWASARNVEEVSMFGINVNILKGTTLPDDFIPAEALQARILRGYSCSSAVADSFISSYGAEASTRITRAFDSEMNRLSYGERCVPEVRESNGVAVLTHNTYFSYPRIETVSAMLERINAIGFDVNAFAEVHGTRAARSVNRWILVARLYINLHTEMQARVSEVLNSTTQETANV